MRAGEVIGLLDVEDGGLTEWQAAHFLALRARD